MRSAWNLVAGALACVLATGAALAGPKQDLMWTQLRDRVTGVEQRLDGVLGVAIVDLGSGQELLVHADDVFPQASSIKVAVLAELFRESERTAHGAKGLASLGDAYTVRAEDLVQDSDIMGGLTPGVTRLTNRDLATMMVAVSDNAATNVLIDRIGMDKVNAMLEELGLHETRLKRRMMDLKAATEGRENVSTPREMATLLAKLYRGEVVGEPWRTQFFDLLATHKQGFLTRELPDDLRVANKPGVLEGVRNDVGVVFVDRRPFVICVMSTYLADERKGEDAIAAIAKSAVSLFERLSRASDYGRVISPANSSPR